jgi:hypothetical protein
MVRNEPVKSGLARAFAMMVGGWLSNGCASSTALVVSMGPTESRGDRDGTGLGMSDRATWALASIEGAQSGGAMVSPTRCSFNCSATCSAGLASRTWTIGAGEGDGRACGLDAIESSSDGDAFSSEPTRGTSTAGGSSGVAGVSTYSSSILSSGSGSWTRMSTAGSTSALSARRRGLHGTETSSSPTVSCAFSSNASVP